MANIYDQFHAPAQVPGAGGNIYDQFDPPTPTTGQERVQNSANPSTGSVSPVPMPQARPDAAPPRVNVFDEIDPPRYNRAQSELVDVNVPAPRENTKDLGVNSPFNDDLPPVPGAPPGSFMKGLATTFLEQNPKLVGAGLRSLGIAVGEKDVDPGATLLQNVGRDVEGWAQDPGAYKMSGIQMTDIRSMDDAQRWFGESVGQAVGSSALSIIPSIAGAAAGGRAFGRAGVAPGAVAGATMGGFPAAQGEVFLALTEAKVDEKTAARAAIPAAMAIAALDSVTPAAILAKLGGRDQVKDAAKKFILRRIAEAAASGAKKEGITEALQEAIKEFDVAVTADNKDFFTKEVALNVINAGGAGAVGGGALMAPGGIPRNKVSTSATPEMVAQTAQETAGTVPTLPTSSPEAVQPLQGTPLRVEAGPENFGQVHFAQSPEVFYSPAKKFIEEKGQNIATPEQWENTLRNAPGIKQEEIADLGLDSFFQEAKDRGEKITKGDMLRELEERSITVEERFLGSDGKTGADILGAKYEDYTLPGDRDGYTELLLHLPPGPATPDYIAPHFGSVGTPGQTANQNLLAHARVSERLDRDGSPVALIEEIQSDWQQAARRGEEVPSAPFKSSWDELTFKRVLRWAADKGYRRIAIASGAEQSRRYSGLTPEQQKGMQEFYDRKMPSMMKKWAKRLGGTVGESQFARDMTFTPLSIDTYHNGYEVINAGTNEVLSERFASRQEAEAAHAVLSEELHSKTPAPSFFTIELPEHGIEKVKEGLPIYMTAPVSFPSATPVPNVEVKASSEELLQAGQALAPALQALLTKFLLNKKTTFTLHDGDIVLRSFGKRGNSKVFKNHLGLAWQKPDGTYEIHINTRMHNNASEIWATTVHEMGHIVQFEHFNSADQTVKSSIKAAYDEYLANVNTSNNPNFRKVLALRDNFTAWLKWGTVVDNRTKLSDQVDQAYWVGFEEWFAEQTAKWATTSQVPLSIVDKFFSGMAKKLLQFWAEAMDKFNLPFLPSKAVADYLDSFHTGAMPFAKDIYKAHDFLTKTANQQVMGAEEAGVPMQPETAAVRERLNKIFEGGWFKWPFAVRQTVAYADKFNLLYKWALGVHQIAQRNPHIIALQQYTEIISVAQLTKRQIMAEPGEVLQKWTTLGEKRADALAAMIEDLQDMNYRTPQEVQQGVVRQPTAQEVQTLIAKHRMDAQQLEVFNGVRKTFDDYLTRFEAVLMKEAGKIADPARRQASIEAAALQIAALRNKPYFPAMRFGNYTITIRNAANQVIHFETFERKGVRDRAAQALKSQYGAQVTNMQLGYMHEQARPLMGVPTKMLDLMEDRLSLTSAQRDALQQLKFELSPAQSFKHRFQHKKKTAGYSMDFRRAYANYFLHGANHMMRVMYADDLRTLAGEVRTETRQFDATKRHQINNFLSDHLESWLSPRSDWMMIRSIGFLYALAFTPAAAAANLTQTVLTTYPFLGSNFGRVQTTATLMKVMGDIHSYHKRGKLENLSGFEYEALSRGIQEGVITEALAPEMAGIASGENFKGLGGIAAERILTKTAEYGSKMFELAEQFNRRIVFRAALKLATSQPNSKYVQNMLTKHALKVEQLKAETTWTDAQVAAYVSALDATHETQFRYSQEFAPRFLRHGAMRSIFMFKTFITSYIAFLGAYPKARYDSLLLLGFMGGLMALPGAEDIKGLTQAIAWQLFGKDYDIEKELRKLVLSFVGEDEKGRQTAEMVLHGSARRGYGIPAFMDMVGSTILTPRDIDPEQKAFRDYIPAPTFDRSKAVSAGTLLPVELGKLFGPPVQDPTQVFTDQSQKALGPVLGLSVAVYKTINNERLKLTDAKRYERLVPRALANVSKASRYYGEEKDRTQTGAAIVTYNPRDPEQLAEIIGVAAGYQPLRQSLKWDTVIAQRNEAKFFDIQRETLMRQFFNAKKGGTESEIVRMTEAIKKFNADLPDEARGKSITGDSLRKSMQGRARSIAAQEGGTSVRKSDVPIMRKVQELYPESRSITRRVE